MTFFRQFLRHPQQLWIRRVNFQVHLWTGVILALYVTMIGFTGSILVFGDELDRLFDPTPWPALDAKRQIADVAVVLHDLTARYPGMRIVSVMGPTAADPVFLSVLQRRRRITIASNPVTGQVLGEAPRRRSRLDWIYELHENLLARRPGRVVNGIGAIALLLLALTGLVNWWPGIQNWRRAVSVDFRRKWKRINFDLHSAAGFWGLAFIALWAISGIYFAWPDKVLAFVDRWSPVVNSLPPSVRVAPEGDIVPLDFASILKKAYAVDPGTQWKGIIFPGTRRSPLEILMSRAPGIGRDYEDTLYFNPYNGEYITTWQYGVNKSLGDWFIWLQIPLHFGTHWGMGIKCLWAVMGLVLPLLAVTGLLMYWNRVLGRRSKQLRKVAPDAFVASKKSDPQQSSLQPD
ncbi:MAG TPA: PepSY-associated TM helix domain-containing protein [Bryobacteraceae bacterium]|nr:PepSY-associated TM helix domain-containing protein [Bryobacteraceae bacterium]